jgi:ribosomal protein S20
MRFTEKRLIQIIEAAAERGAILALEKHERGPVVDWITKDDALKMIGAGRSVLDSLVRKKVIRKNDYTRSTRLKYYYRPDILRYIQNGPVPLPQTELTRIINAPK